jgi:hypothetical protein
MFLLDLEGFRWSNPLKKLQKEKENSACPAFYNIYLDYEDLPCLFDHNLGPIKRRL